MSLRKEFLGHGFIDEMKMFRRLAQHGLELLSEKDHPNIGFLQQIHQVYGFLEQEFPVLIERWEKEPVNERGRSGG